MLWLSAIAAPICLGAAYVFRGDPLIERALVIVGLAPIGVTCIGFIYFALTKPEKLQSEDYQLRHEALQTIQQKAGQLIVDTTSLHAITNPQVPLLPSKAEAAE